MNLKLNEILFLKTYFSEHTPISIFNNLNTSLNGTEMLGLLEKGVLSDNQLAQNAVIPLHVLAEPKVCTRVTLKNPYCAIEKYIYRKDNTRILVENEQEEISVNLFENEDIFIKNWEQWLGNSLVKIADFSVHLSFSELLVFLALIDYNRLNVLRGYLGDLGNKESLSLMSLEKALNVSNSNTLVNGLIKNYGFQTPTMEQIKVDVAVLHQKGILESGSELMLTPVYKSFSQHFLVPDNVMMLEGIQVVGENEIQAANTLVFGYGLFNWLVIGFEKDGVDVFTTTSAELLSVIRDYSRCD